MASFNPFQEVLDWAREKATTTPPELQPEIVVETPDPLIPVPEIPIPEIKCGEVL